jgi:hypothetical protein
MATIYYMVSMYCILTHNCPLICVCVLWCLYMHGIWHCYYVLTKKVLAPVQDSDLHYLPAVWCPKGHSETVLYLLIYIIIQENAKMMVNSERLCQFKAIFPLACLITTLQDAAIAGNIYHSYEDEAPPHCSNI